MKTHLIVGVLVAVCSFSSFAQSARGNAGGAVKGKERAVAVRQGNVDRLTAKKGADAKPVVKQTENLGKFKTKQGLETPAPEAPAAP